MPGNVLNAKLVLFVALVKTMINFCFAMIVIVDITCIVWCLLWKNLQKDLGVVISVSDVFTQNLDYIFVSILRLFIQKQFHVHCTKFSLKNAWLSQLKKHKKESELFITTFLKIKIKNVFITTALFSIYYIGVILYLFVIWKKRFAHTGFVWWFFKCIIYFCMYICI